MAGDEQTRLQIAERFAVSLGMVKKLLQQRWRGAMSPVFYMFNDRERMP